MAKYLAINKANEFKCLGAKFYMWVFIRGGVSIYAGKGVLGPLRR